MSKQDWEKTLETRRNSLPHDKFLPKDFKKEETEKNINDSKINNDNTSNNNSNININNNSKLNELLNQEKEKLQYVGLYLEPKVVEALNKISNSTAKKGRGGIKSKVANEVLKLFFIESGYIDN